MYRTAAVDLVRIELDLYLIRGEVRLSSSNRTTADTCLLITAYHLNDPSCIGTFQWSCAHDLTREVINGYQDLNRPQTPT